MLIFSDTTANFSQVREGGFTITKENYGNGDLYQLTIDPSTYMAIARAIGAGILSMTNLYMKSGSRYGYYAAPLEEIEKFLRSLEHEDLFLTHSGVSIWHTTALDGISNGNYYATKPKGTGISFLLSELGIGPMLDGEESLWLDAVKDELRRLIDEGHIVSGKKPRAVQNAVSKRVAFSEAPNYGHRW